MRKGSNLSSQKYKLIRIRLITDHILTQKINNHHVSWSINTIVVNTLMQIELYVVTQKQNSKTIRILKI